MRNLAKPIIGLAFLGMVGAVAANFPASADQSACRNLEAQLASVTRGSDNKQIRRYERAIISQQQQLERARNQQKNAGCSTLLSSIKPQCGPVRATVSKMERNLLSLQRTKNELTGGGGAPREKARIVAALNDNGCQGGTTRTAERDVPGGLFGRIFGGQEKAAKTLSTDDDQPNQSPRNYSAAPGQYRTVCVRTCDGYFFPIAYSSSPALFERDQKACEAMCPGTDVALYHHKVPDEETDAMVSSISGTPYTQLPTAYKYRQPGYERAASCQCNTQSTPKNFSIIAGETRDQAEPEKPQDEAIVVPRPESRPDPAEDPETSANRDGGLDAAAIADLLAPKIAADLRPAMDEQAPEAPREHQIRVVGPKFLPDPQAAIDLRVQDQTQLR